MGPERKEVDRFGAEFKRSVTRNRKEVKIGWKKGKRNRRKGVVDIKKGIGFVNKREGFYG